MIWRDKAASTVLTVSCNLLGHSSAHCQDRASRASALVLHGKPCCLRDTNIHITRHLAHHSSRDPRARSTFLRPSYGSCDRAFSLPRTDGGLHFLCRPGSDSQTQKVRVLHLALGWSYSKKEVEEADSWRATLAKGDFQTTHLSPCQRCPDCRGPPIVQHRFSTPGAP